MFEIGKPKTGGRQVGTPNKVTQSARAAIATLLDNNADKLQVWLDEVYTNEGALAAFRCFAYLLEFHVPKLARTELVRGQSEAQAIDAGMAATVQFLEQFAAKQDATTK